MSPDSSALHHASRTVLRGFAVVVLMRKVQVPRETTAMLPVGNAAKSAAAQPRADPDGVARGAVTAPEPEKAKSVRNRGEDRRGTRSKPPPAYSAGGRRARLGATRGGSSGILG